MITRRGFLLQQTAMLAQQRRRRPNFLFLLADDMGWGDLPSYGHRAQKAYGGPAAAD